MQGEKVESNENTYFQHFARRKSPARQAHIGPIPNLNVLLSMRYRKSNPKTCYSPRPLALIPRRPSSPLLPLHPLLPLPHYFFTSSAGIFFIPIYGRKTSGTTI